MGSVRRRGTSVCGADGRGRGAFGLESGHQADLLTGPEIDLRVRALGTEATPESVVDSTDAAFNSARESAGAVVEHDSTLRLPGVSRLDDPVV